MIVYVAWVNMRGAGSRRWQRAALVVIADLGLQLLIVLFGLALLLEPHVLSDPGALAGSPDAEQVLFAFTIAIAAFSGLDASSALAGEVARVAPRPQAAVRRARGGRRARTSGIALVASSTLPHLYARYVFEKLTDLVVEVEIASEMRYRKTNIRPGTVVVGISQSGETADTIAAMHEASRKGALLLGLVNVVGSP